VPGRGAGTVPCLLVPQVLEFFPLRPRVVLGVWLAALLGAALLAFPPSRGALATAGGHARAAAGLPAAGSDLRLAAQSAPPAPTLRVPDGGVTIPDGYSLVGWALLDRTSGKIMGGSGNAATMTNYTESMIKPWIAADYMSRTVKAGRKPSQQDLSQLRSMIIHSDNWIASRYYDLGGKDSVIRRLNQVCGLHTTIAMSGWWSYTAMTPDDAAHYGECLADGTAAGAYTSNLLTWMRQVVGGVADQPQGASAHTGGGRWGIIDALPPSLASQTSIKNGWEPEISGHEWHVNCLAILPGRVLTVMVRYPWTSPTGDWRDADNLAAGASACKNIAAQLVYTPAG
jgi:hypothetical protein